MYIHICIQIYHNTTISGNHKSYCIYLSTIKLSFAIMMPCNACGKPLYIYIQDLEISRNLYVYIYIYISRVRVPASALSPFNPKSFEVASTVALTCASKISGFLRRIGLRFFGRLRKELPRMKIRLITIIIITIIIIIMI